MSSKAEEVLREVLKDREEMVRKLQALIDARLIGFDILAIVLSRLENLEDDILNAIDEIK